MSLPRFGYGQDDGSRSESRSPKSATPQMKSPKQMSMRSGHSGRNAMGNGFRSQNRLMMNRGSNKTPAPIYRGERAPEIQNNVSRSMMVSKSVQKMDTVSNVSRMDIERVGEFNEALRKKLSYEWKNIYRSLLQSDVLQKGSISAQKFN